MELGLVVWELELSQAYLEIVKSSSEIWYNLLYHDSGVGATWCSSGGLRTIFFYEYFARDLARPWSL